VYYHIIGFFSPFSIEHAGTKIYLVHFADNNSTLLCYASTGVWIHGIIQVWSEIETPKSMCKLSGFPFENSDHIM